jgi:hypothetical protein
MNSRTKLILGLALFSRSLAACDADITPVAQAAARAAPASRVAELPADLVDRAAMCQGAFTAQFAPSTRNGETITEDQLNIAMHPAYIAASENGIFDSGRLEAVGAKGPAYADRFRQAGGAGPVIAKCAEAFPAMTRSRRLAQDPRKSRRTCAAVAAALLETYEMTDRVKIGKAPAYAKMLESLQEDVVRDLWKDDDTDEGAMKLAFHRSLAEAMSSAPPGKIIGQCLERYA